MSSRNTKAHNCMRNAKQQRRSSRLAPDRTRGFRLGTGVVGWFDFGNVLKHSIVLNEGTSSCRTPLVAMLLPPSRFQTEERVEEVVRIATQQCAGQPNDPVSAGS